MNDLVVIQEAKLIDLLRTVIADEIGKRMEAKAPRPKVKGIHGLAEALNCSVAKAQKLKNSGTIRYFQDQKLVLFDYDQVMEDLKGVNINKRGRKPKDGR